MLQHLWALLQSADTLQKVIATFLLAVGIFLLRFLLYRFVRFIADNREMQRRWMVSIRNVLLFLFFFGIIIIWAVQLRLAALSVAAVAAAIVLATRDLLMCLGGSLVKTLSQAFGLNDRIEVDGIRGDVIDQTLLSTTILEIGPGDLNHGYTGRAVTIPNALFLTKGVVNETYTEHYVLHVFTVPIQVTHNWKRAEEILLKAATEICAPFAELGKLHFEKLGRRRGLDTPTTESRVTLTVREPGIIDLVVRICVPARQRGRAEQAILRKFLESFTELFTNPSRAQKESSHS